MYNNKHTICIFVFVFLIFSPPVALFAQITNPTANDMNSYIPFVGTYDFGSNMGYYGSQFTDQDIAQLAFNSGSHTIRPSLPDWLITGYGATSRVSAFQYYQSLGMKDVTVFVGEPNEPTTHAGTGPDDRETTIFPGATERAKIFKGLYEPIWLDTGKTQINPANTFAHYMYTTVHTYGQYVKFWEIVNEPDFTYGSNGWADKSQATSWWNVNPNPEELTNLKAPIFYYIRELRVAYDVIKTLQPHEYVATGGLGYPSFLDALMRNTDNPVDGSVTVQYPQKGGAYFDVLSFHSYPMYSLRHWSNAIMDFVYTRHSDGAVDVFFGAKNDFDVVLKKYGYDGTTYPQKQWISTETDIPQQSVSDVWGSQDSADNYIMKVHILAQTHGISEIYKYGLGESGSVSSGFDVTGVYGNLTPSSTTIANAPKTEQFKATKTLDDVLYGKTYDANKTLQLNLPSGVRGVAFRDVGGVYTYALWAVTSIDKSESASISYTFPFSFSGMRREWDFSSTNQSTPAGQTIILSGSPSFFTETSAVVSQNNNNTNYYVPPYVYNPPVVHTYVSSAAVPIQHTFAKISTVATGLNVRMLPFGKIVARVPYGTRGFMIEQKTVSDVTWMKVAFENGVGGWVSARYIQAR